MVDFKQTIDFLQAAINATEDLIFVKDKDFYYRAVNKPLCENYLLREDQIVGHKDDELLPEETINVFRHIDVEVIEKGKTIKVEELVTFPSGKKVLLETVKSPCFDEDGNIIALIGIARDITERKKAEQELQNAKDAADLASRAKSQFLSNMSHEIRTPMNAVLGFSQILQELELDPNKKFYLESILNAGRSLLSIINDILDLSKVEAGFLSLQYSPIEMGPLLDELEEFFSQRVKEKDLVFNIESKKTDRVLLVDAVRLRQVLINIINNAIKFTDSGSISVIVELKCLNSYKNLGHLNIRIKDSGIGIDEDQQQGIFETFQQARGQKAVEYGGTGLGLAISKKLVELMGGNIQLESTKGQGSTFIIDIPEVELTSRDVLELNSQCEVDMANVDFEPATIIIADDIDFNRDVLRGFLKPFKFNIIEVSDGQELLKVMTVSKPDLVLLDIKMPEVSGLEVAQLIRLNGNDKTPLIAVTASAMDEDKKRISEFTDSYLRKPVVKKDLILEIMKYLKFKS